MNNRIAAALLMACCMTAAAPADSNAQSADARQAAETWLALIDGNDFAKSWQDASRAFKDVVDEEQWVAQMTAGRQQTGTLSERELARSQAVTDPPGAPAGEYVQLQYDSRFSVLGPVSEHVVLVRDGDRGWRVAGYYLRPPQ
jgi:hypothetical protein